MDHLNRILIKELEVLELGSKIQSQVQSEVGKNQREYFLREQMKAIQKELGEGDDQTKEIEELRQKIDAAGLPEAVLKEAQRELDRLSKMPVAAAEYTVSRTYLDWIVMLPWQKRSDETIDLPRTKAILDADHAGLEKAKDRILEYLAVRKLNPSVKGPILCFAGPPGVGKTSLARSIATSLGRKFVRVSLGGMRDEAEIRGHRRTYIGALPGPDHPGAAARRDQEPGLHPRRDRQAGVRLPRRPGVGAARGAGPRAEHQRSAITTWTCPSTCPRCCSSPPPTCWTRCRRRCATAWRCWRSPATPSRRSWPSPSSTWCSGRSRTTASPRGSCA